MKPPSVSDLVAQRQEAAVRAFDQEQSEKTAAIRRPPPVSYGTAITKRVMGSQGSGVDPTAVTDKTRREGERAHLIDILV